MKKFFAVICTLITLYVLKETYVIFTSAEADVVKQRPILIVISLSILIPMIVVSLWLWRPGRKNN